MKILIAYDGSECADAAIEDLKVAGLPKTTEALALSVANVFLPPDDEEVGNGFPAVVPASVRRAHERALQKLKDAEQMAELASKQIKASFPDWQVSHQALADSPAWALIKTAAESKSDLLVVGARGHSVFGGRLILGSVSQRVLYEASCSVRVARDLSKDPGSPLRIIIGVDNSTDSQAAVAAVSEREWPEGTEVRLLVAVDTVMAVTPDPSEPSVVKWIEVADESNWDEVRQVFEASAQRLRGKGLDAAVMIRRGRPGDQLVDEAESWGADCIFVGAKGSRGLDRLLLGSVSASVAAHAPCSVEVVRPPVVPGD